MRVGDATPHTYTLHLLPLPRAPMKQTATKSGCAASTDVRNWTSVEDCWAGLSVDDVLATQQVRLLEGMHQCERWGMCRCVVPTRAAAGAHDGRRRGRLRAARGAPRPAADAPAPCCSKHRAPLFPLLLLLLPQPPPQLFTPFCPVYGTTYLPRLPLVAFQAGDVADVPIIMGTVRGRTSCWPASVGRWGGSRGGRAAPWPAIV